MDAGASGDKVERLLIKGPGCAYRRNQGNRSGSLFRAVRMSEGEKVHSPGPAGLSADMAAGRTWKENGGRRLKMGDRRAPRILVVDDEVIIALTVAQFLEDEGFVAIMAHDGQQALDLARRERPDAVITDYMMPRINGQELARTLRQDQDLAGVPIVLTSAMPPKQLDGEFTDVFTKPYQLSELVQAIRRLVTEDGGKS